MNFDEVRWIDLNITDLCNLTCRFCPRHDPEVWPNQNIHMPLYTISKVTDDLIRRGYKRLLSFTGRGESALHDEWEEAYKILTRPDRTYMSHVTHNTVQIKKYWPYLKKLDHLTLNVYTTQEDFNNVRKNYSRLDNGNAVRLMFKPDGESDEVLEQKYNFTTNNRAGLIFSDGNPWATTPCVHPITHIFINYDGTYELCCNDWNYKTKIGNVIEQNIVDIYEKNPRLNRAALKLLKGDRTCERACVDCDSPWYAESIQQQFLNDPEILYDMSMMALQDE